MNPLLPENLCELFESELNLTPDPVRNKKLWNAAQRLIKALKLPPEEWGRLPHALYGYFEQRALSPDYAKKIIRVLNMWGEFFCRHSNTAYKSVKAPGGYARGRIQRKYRECLKSDKASDGLTPKLLSGLKCNVSELQFQWLFISFWFGLRPQEIDNLKKGEGFWFEEFDPIDKREWLCIKQTKLINLSDEEQWKRIPVLYSEQKWALTMIRESKFDRPLPKTIKRYTLGNHHLYAGRKGFAPYMWEKGHDVVEVSSWLGHKSIDRTYRDYMKWKQMKLRKVG